MNRISVCLITLNEEENLRRVLKSVQGIADETVVVDCGSKDGTERVAKEYGAKFVFREWTNFAIQKNLAADAAGYDWILSLDADEELSEELQRSLLEWKQQKPDFDVYEFARRTWYLGGWVWHTRWYPDFQRKLYRKNKSKFEVPEHATVKFAGRAGLLKGDLLHYTIRSVEEHEAKVQSITSRQAKYLYQEGRRSWRAAKWLASPWNWFNNYVLRLGFLDGHRGWMISKMAARGTWLKFAKLGKLIAQDKTSRGNKMR